MSARLDPAVVNLQKRYHKRYDEHVNWPLTRPLSVGDIGKWSSGKSYGHETNVSKLGITVAVRKGALVATRAFSTTGGVVTKFKATGQAPDPGTQLIQAKAGVSIALNSRYACVLRANQLEQESVADVPALEAGLLSLNKTAEWWKNRVVITAVLHAKIATAALSHSRNQRIDIHAGASTPVPFDIADAKLSLEIGHQTEDTSVDLQATDPIIAFEISRFRRGGWRHSWNQTDLFLGK